MRLFLCTLCIGLLLAPLRAQDQPASSQVDELKALIYVLQKRLVRVEKELGQEKARRAELEDAELERARETLEPGVKKKLGLPVTEAPKTEKPVTPQTPSK
jgi:hypothetical protein